MEKHPELSIKELIRAVQKELILSEKTRKEEKIPQLFEVESLDIEIKFAIKRETNKKGGVDFKLIALQLGKAKSAEEVHTLRLKLKANPKKEKEGVSMADVDRTLRTIRGEVENGSHPHIPITGGHPIRGRYPIRGGHPAVGKIKK